MDPFPQLAKILNDENVFSSGILIGPDALSYISK